MERTTPTTTTPGRPRRRHPLRLVRAVIAVVAVVQQLRLPRAERTWHGAVGFVPFDFRRPTWDRARARLWSPDEPHLLTPRIFGVGWTPNVGRMVALARGQARR